MAKKDWTGQTFNRLTFIKPTNKISNRSILWEASCTCGSVIIVRPIDVKRGGTKSCGCWNKERSKKFGMSCRQFSPIISSARSVWRRTYADGDITFEDFYKLSQDNCFYCGLAPYKTYNLASKIGKGYVSDIQKDQGDFTFNGLDRLDSSKGHDLDNVVPCCYRCNWMKMSLTVSDFFEHIQRIINHHVK